MLWLFFNYNLVKWKLRKFLLKAHTYLWYILLLIFFKYSNRRFLCVSLYLVMYIIGSGILRWDYIEEMWVNICSTVGQIIGQTRDSPKSIHPCSCQQITGFWPQWSSTLRPVFYNLIYSLNNTSYLRYKEK